MHGEWSRAQLCSIEAVKYLEGHYSASVIPSEQTASSYIILLQCIQKFFSQILFDFIRMVSHSISPKFSGKIPYVLSKPRIYFLGSKDKTVLC